MSSENAIKVENLCKVYHIYDQPRDRLKQFFLPRVRGLIGQVPKNYFQEFWALRDVSIEVKKGETIGIIGRNGSGKSTLLQIICGTLSPTTGTVETNGRIAALLELGSGFNPEFTGRENVYMNAAVLGLNKEEVNARFNDIVAFADIGDFIEQPVKTYSSGMLVRLAFAVSVSVAPDILVVDEALAVGDMAFQQKCLQRLADLSEQGTTILLVTHDIMLTRNYCGRVIYLDRGLVKRIGDAESVGEMYVRDMFSEKQNALNGGVLEWREGGGEKRLGFGTSLGRIISVLVTGSKSAGNCFQQGEHIVVDIRGEVVADVKNPEFVFQLRDYRGYVLYGISTKPKDLMIISSPTHVKVNAHLSFSIELGAGTYSITLGFNDRQGEGLVTLLDKIVGVTQFSVIDNNNEKFHGCINLHGTWGLPESAQPDALVKKSQKIWGSYDIGDENLRSALARSMAPQILSELVILSRSLFGWFSKCQTRCDEYVWISSSYSHFHNMLFLDIGSGVSPLPVYFANQGHTVLTIDSSDIQRVPGNGEIDWNGWGFLDYSLLHKNISSINGDATDSTLDGQMFNLCYSVSVIEHLTAASRRKLLSSLKERIMPGGSLMLTVDLVPETNKLWNMAQGQLVEPQEIHGELDDLIRELLQCGFYLVESKILRNYPDEPRTDVGYIHCRLGDLR